MERMNDAEIRAAAAAHALPCRARPRRARVASKAKLWKMLRDRWSALLGQTRGNMRGSPLGGTSFLEAMALGRDIPMDSGSAATALRYFEVRLARANSRPIENAVVDWWVALMGLPDAVEAAARYADARWDYGAAYDPLAVSVEGVEPLTRLRTHLSACSEASWRAALARAEALRIVGSQAQRVALAFLFPERPAWADALAEERLDPSGWWPRFFPMAGALLGSVGDDRMVGRLAKALPADREWAVSTAWTLLANFGPALGADILTVARPIGIEALLAPDEAVSLLTERVGWQRDELARECIEVAPRHIIPRMAAGSESVVRSLGRVLAALTGAHRAAALPVVLSLEGSVRAELAAVMGEPSGEGSVGVEADVAPAPASALPEALRVPAHRRRRRAASNPFEALGRIPPAMAWLPGEREAWLAEVPPAPAEPASTRVAGLLEHLGLPASVARLATAEDDEGLAALAAAGRRRPRLAPATLLPHLPRRLALRLWNTLPAGTFVALGVGVEYWLATVELAALPGVLALLDDRVELGLSAARAFAAVEVVPYAARLLAGDRTQRGLARSWLLRHAAVSARWALSAASGGAKGRALARGVLDLLRDEGLAEVIESVGAEAGPTGAATALAWMQAFPNDQAPKRAPKAPPWWEPMPSPRPTTREGAPLGDEAMENLRILLASCEPDAIFGGLAEALEALAPGSLDPLLCALLRRWDDAGRPPAQRWVVHAAAHVGGPSVSRCLGRLAERWANADYAAATDGIAALARLGHDAAIASLSTIEIRRGTSAVGQRAARAVADVAARRGLSESELWDRRVPTPLLPEGGVRRLSFGSRSFTAEVNAALGITLRDADGRVLEKLPRPRKGESGAVVTEARDALDGLRWMVEPFAPIVRDRLLEALWAGPTWTRDAFDAFVVRHPLVGRVAPSVLWGVYADEQLVDVGLLEPEGQLRSASGAIIEVGPSQRVGVVHPVELGAEGAAEWVGRLQTRGAPDVLGQLTRPVFTLDPARTEGVEIVQCEGTVLSDAACRRLAETPAWRAVGSEGPYRTLLARAVPGGLIGVAHLSPGLLAEPASYAAPASQTLGRMAFGSPDGVMVPPDTVRPSIISEFVRALLGAAPDVAHSPTHMPSSANSTSPA